MVDEQSDELTYGPARAAPRWPRGWLTGTAVVAALAALLGWQLRGSGNAARRSPTTVAPPSALPTPTPTATPTPSASAAPVPGTFEGPVLQDGLGAEVLLGGRQPSVVTLPSGRVTPIIGLPEDHEVTSAVRVRGATLLQVGAEDREARVAVYSLADGTTRARSLRISGFAMAPAETDRTFWVYAQTADQSAVRAEERDGAGRLLRRTVLPKQWYPLRGVTGGLLVTEYHPRDGMVELKVWDPQRRRVVRSLGRGDHPAATTPTRVAWPDRLCSTASEGCILHVTDLRTGADVVIPLPQGYQAPTGAFSPDGSALVLTMSESTFEQTSRVFAVGLDTGNVVPLTGAGGLEGGATVSWTPSGDAVVLSASQASGGSAMAVWRRSASGVETVPGTFDGTWVIAVQPAR